MTIQASQHPSTEGQVNGLILSSPEDPGEGTISTWEGGGIRAQHMLEVMQKLEY